MAETTFLERIVAATRQTLAERITQVPLDAMMARAAAAPAPRPFAAALRPATDDPAKLIAEVKRASPSKGLLAETFDPVAQARAYAAGGAAAISVLTEPHFFLGALEHLRAVRAAVDVPVLRKDFILDEYQVYEARAAGADAILLICAMLDDTMLARLYALAARLGMGALVEAHNAEELARARQIGAQMIGVNSRDLRTFAVDHDIVRKLRHEVPTESIFVAESGIADRLSAARARAWGADAILVGEALMRAPDPTQKARELATASGGVFARLFGRSANPFIKLCGLAQPEHGALAAELGAGAIGFIFAPSRRSVTPTQARAVIEAAHHADPHCAPLAVGVFVNEAPETLADIVTSAKLDAIQLSGDETPDACAEVAARTQLPVIKALRLRSERDLEALDAYALSGTALLLDTPSTDGSYGGSGQTGDWALARRAAERWPVILSGGLSPQNVTEALAAVQPAGVDVSSGIETDGVKDTVKMRAFVEAAVLPPLLVGARE